MLRTQYSPYNASFLKYFTLVVVAGCLDYGNNSLQPIKELCFLKNSLKIPLVIGKTLTTGYHINNLYEQYQYNCSLEKTLKLQLQDSVIDVQRSVSSYFDMHTLYNISGAIGSLFGGIGMLLSEENYCYIGGAFGIIEIISKICDVLSPESLEYKFTNLENGSTIDINLIESAYILV